MKTERISNLSLTTITRFAKEQLIKRLEEQQSSARYALSFVQDSEILRDIEMDLRITEIARASLEAEPVSFDALRDAVAEVSGGAAMEWSDIYKGHQAVPFINFNSLARIVDKFRADPPAPVVPNDLAKAFISAIEKEQDRLFGEDYLMDSKDCIDVIREEALRLSACRAAMFQGSQPVSNRDELPPDEIECDICGHVSTDPEGRHYCCEDNSND